MRTITLQFTLVALFMAFAATGAHALKRSDLTPKEEQRYATLAADTTAAENFLITREYVRQADAVVTGKSPAIGLPDEPDQFEAKYLFPGESKMIQKAVVKAISAFIDSRAKKA